MFFVAGERAVGRHLGENALQGDARAARHAESARDFPLAGFAVRSAQEFKDLLFARQTAIGGNARNGALFPGRRPPS
jgi:hypothetical protein